MVNSRRGRIHSIGEDDIYFVLYFTLYTSISFIPVFYILCFVFYSCVFGLLVLLLFRQISPWGLIKYLSIYLSIYIPSGDRMHRNDAL